LLTELLQLWEVKQVRDDPVARALAAGLQPKSSPFEQGNVVVSALRNAGVFTNQTPSAPAAVPASVPKGTKTPTAGVVSDSSKKKGSKPIRFNPAFKVVLDDAQRQKGQEWVEQQLAPFIKAREQPDSIVVTTRLVPMIVEETHANGKTSRRTTGYKKGDDGKYLTVVKEEKVKDLSDFDLAEAIGLVYQNDLFKGYKPETAEADYPSLKGTDALTAMTSKRGWDTILTVLRSGTSWAKILGPSQNLLQAHVKGQKSHGLTKAGKEAELANLLTSVSIQDSAALTSLKKSSGKSSAGSSGSGN